MFEAKADDPKFNLLHPKYIPLFAIPPIKEKGKGQGESNGQRDEPQLQYEAETSSLQLFYDLFFVANLTTFTGDHEINNGEGEFPLPISATCR
jgi:hypothetical protein